MGVPYVELTSPAPGTTAAAAPAEATKTAATNTTANATAGAAAANAAGANRKFVIMASSIVLTGPTRIKQFLGAGILLVLVTTILLMVITVFTLVSKEAQTSSNNPDAISHRDAVVNVDPPPLFHKFTALHPTHDNEVKAKEDAPSSPSPYEHEEEEDDEDDEEEDTTPLSTPYLTIVSRKKWHAEPPTGKIEKLETPVPYVIITHTTTSNCSTSVHCSFLARTIQMFHQESKGWWDVGYNFLVGGDGNVYEGRGWTKSGFHTLGYNYKSIGIAFIGTFAARKPPSNQLAACQRLIEEGVELGYIGKNYTLFGERQLQSTTSPGNALFKEIKTWSHWQTAP